MSHGILNVHFVPKADGRHGFGSKTTGIYIFYLGGTCRHSYGPIFLKYASLVMRYFHR